MAAPTTTAGVATPYGPLPYAGPDPDPDPPSPFLGLLGDVLVVLGGLGFTVLLALAMDDNPRLGPRALVLVAGTLVLLGMVTLALTRFEDYIVVLLVVRTSLDYVKPTSGGGLLEPPTVIGALTLVLGASWLWQRRKRGLIVGFSRVTLVLVALSALTFVNPLFAVGPFASLQSATRILSFTVLFVVLEQIFRTTPDRRRPFLNAMLLSLVIPAAVAVLQLTRSSGTAQYLDVGRVRGTFFHPNPFGTYLVLILIIGYALATTARTKAGRLPYYGASIAAATLLIFTYARSAWLAAILGAVVLGIRVNRRILAVLAIGAVIILVAVPSVATRLSDLDDQAQVNAGDPNSLAWRVGYWEEILPYGLSSPVGGTGLESSGQLTGVGLEPHNVFVQAFVELGVPGLLAVLALIVAVVNEVHRADYWARDHWERVLAASATAIGVGFFIQLFSENLLTQPVTLWYFGLAVAAALANGWEDGVSPVTIRGELSVRQRVALAIQQRRYDDGVSSKRPARQIPKLVDLLERKLQAPGDQAPAAAHDDSSTGSPPL